MIWTRQDTDLNYIEHGTTRQEAGHESYNKLIVKPHIHIYLELNIYDVKC